MYDVRCCSWAVPLELEVVARTEAFLVITAYDIGRLRERRTWLEVA